jgi:excisionase family DNA binding protein
MGSLAVLTGCVEPPSLGELAADPSRVAEIPPEAVPGLLAQAAAVQAALAVRLVVPSRPAPVTPAETDRLLTPAEAATMLGVAVPWLYRHANRLPFTRRLSRRTLRFSEAGVKRWLSTRRS